MHQRLLVVRPNHHHNNVCERRLERKNPAQKPEKVHFCAGKSVICKSGGLCVDESEATKKAKLTQKYGNFGQHGR